MISDLTRKNARVVLNFAYRQLVHGQRQRFTFWGWINREHIMFKMQKNSKGIFWVVWKWANSWDGYTKYNTYQLADENLQPLDYQYHMKMLNERADRMTQIEELTLMLPFYLEKSPWKCDATRAA